MRLRIGLVAIAVGMLVGVGMPSQGQLGECAASDGQKGPDFNRQGLRLAAAKQPSKCEVARLSVPQHLVETEGGPPLKVQDGEHVVGTASLGGKQFQLKMLVSKGKQTDILVYSGGRQLQGTSGGGLPQRVQECLRQHGVGSQGPHGWRRWVRDLFVLVPEAEAVNRCQLYMLRDCEYDASGHITSCTTYLIGCDCKGRNCSAIRIIPNS